MGCGSSVIAPSSSPTLVNVRPSITTPLPPPQQDSTTTTAASTTNTNCGHTTTITTNNNDTLLQPIVPSSSSAPTAHQPLHSIMRQPSKGKLLLDPADLSATTPPTASSSSPHHASNITVIHHGHHPSTSLHQHPHHLHHQSSRSHLRHHSRLPSTGGGGTSGIAPALAAAAAAAAASNAAASHSHGDTASRRSMRRPSEIIPGLLTLQGGITPPGGVLHVNSDLSLETFSGHSGALIAGTNSRPGSRPASRPVSRPASAKPPPKISPRAITHLVLLCSTKGETDEELNAIREHCRDEEVGASPAFESASVWAPAMEAAVAMNNISIVRLLIQMGASPQVYGTSCMRHLIPDPNASSLASATAAAIAHDKCAPAPPLGNCTPVHREKRSQIHHVTWLYHAADGTCISHREGFATPLFDACRGDQSRLKLVDFLLGTAHATPAVRRLDLGPPSSRWRAVHDHWYGHDLNGAQLTDVQVRYLR
jgi:hypothetical protein